MPESKNTHQQDRKFLHDIAGKLAVIRLVIKRLISEYDGSRPAGKPADQMERLQKALQALDDAEKLHADQKAKITEREAA